MRVEREIVGVPSCYLYPNCSSETDPWRSAANLQSRHFYSSKEEEEEEDQMVSEEEDLMVSLSSSSLSFHACLCRWWYLLFGLDKILGVPYVEKKTKKESTFV